MNFRPVPLLTYEADKNFIGRSKRLNTYSKFKCSNMIGEKLSLRADFKALQRKKIRKKKFLTLENSNFPPTMQCNSARRNIYLTVLPVKQKIINQKPHNFEF